MDTGREKFKEVVLTPDVEAMLQKIGRRPGEEGLFQVGETVVLKGSAFKVMRITRKEMVLHLLKRPDGTVVP